MQLIHSNNRILDNECSIKFTYLEGACPWSRCGDRNRPMKFMVRSKDWGGVFARNWIGGFHSRHGVFVMEIGV